MTIVRPPAVAGLFYPAERALLERDVDGFLSSARPPRRAEAPKALVVPHAGYIYSGPVAASAYAALQPWAKTVGSDARIVLLGPAHRVRAEGLVLPAADVLETPLGAVDVDAAAVAQLTKMPQVSISSAVHAREHSLEVHLPFLQRILPRFTIVPLAVGNAHPTEVAEVIEALWGGDETRIIVSSDLSHYLPYATARRVDEATAAAIERADRVDPDQACGARAVNGLALVARRRGMRIDRLDLRSSGDTAGSADEVVGYGAFAYFDPPGEAGGVA
jgi:hypothetical protein